MALPSFFERSATAAAHVLERFDREAFESRLLSTPIALAFDRNGGSSTEGRASLDLAGRLLARLFPRVAIVPLRDAPSHVADELATQMRAINPEIELRRTARGAAATLVVGTTTTSAGHRQIYIGSNGWLTRVSTTEPAASGSSANPFAAGAAACFGVANVFRLVFSDQLRRGQLDEDLRLSVLDFSQGGTACGPDIPEIALGESHLVGLGAIGNGAVWALARLPRLEGTLNLVDHEPVEPTNLQRYVLTDQHSIDAAKVELGAAHLANVDGLKVQPHELRWGDYLDQRRDWRLEQVAVAVDSAAARRAIQGSLPRWVGNSWTQPTDLGVSRHDFLSGACMACLYLPQGKVLDEDEIVATALRMPEERQLVRRMLHRGEPVARPLLEQIASAHEVPVEALLPFEGRLLREFYVGAICGGVVFQARMSSDETGADKGGPDRNGAVVPMAFQSALAGILLAAELVVHAGDLREHVLPTMTRINLLRPLAPHLNFAEPKSGSGRCICQDQDFMAAFEEKYGSAHNDIVGNP